MSVKMCRAIHTVVFALVAAASISPVHVLEFCQSTDRDCHSHDRTTSDSVKSRWNMNASNLIQDLEQFRVSCKNLLGKTGSGHYRLRCLNRCQHSERVTIVLSSLQKHSQ